MPIVDYNRIYHVQSRERKPVLNPVNVPDAAGAFIRAGVPAAGAALPGLRARLNDANARYRERVGRDRDRFRAIGDLIGVGKDVALAYAGAVERRDEADLNALQAAWQDHMNQGAEDAWRRPYKRGGENGAKPDGPLVAIRELDAAFDESDAMNGARPAVKQRFAEWRRRASQRYYLKAQDKQTEAADLFQKNAFAASLQAAKDEVTKYYDLDGPNDERGLFAGAVDNVVRIATDKYAWEAARAGQPIPDGELERLKTSITENETMNRVKYLCAVEASRDTPAGDTDSPEIAFVKSLVADDKVFSSPADRLAVNGLVESARQQRERNVAAKDSRTAQQVSDMILLVENGELPDERLEASVAENGGIALGIREEIQRTVSGITKPGLQAKLLDDADAAIATRKAINWLTRYNADGADRTAMLEEHSKMPDGREKDILTRQLYGGSSSAARWTPTNANNLLAAGEKPADVIEQAQRAVTDGAMSGEDYRKVQDAVRAKVSFDRLAGERSGEFLAGIVGAVDDAFGVRIGDILELDRKTGLPKCDKDGNPIPARGYNPANTRRSEVGRRTHTVEARTLSGVREVEDSPGLRVADSAMLDAVRLGMEYVSQRLSGFDGKGNKGSHRQFAQRYAVRGELAEYFRTVLAEQGADLSSEMLSIAILSARERAETLGTPPSLRAAWDEQYLQNNRYNPQ